MCVNEWRGVNCIFSIMKFIIFQWFRNDITYANLYLGVSAYVWVKNRLPSTLNIYFGVCKTHPHENLHWENK